MSKNAEKIEKPGLRFSDSNLNVRGLPLNVGFIGIGLLTNDICDLKKVHFAENGHFGPFRRLFDDKEKGFSSLKFTVKNGNYAYGII